MTGGMMMKQDMVTRKVFGAVAVGLVALVAFGGFQAIGAFFAALVLWPKPKADAGAEAETAAEPEPAPAPKPAAAPAPKKAAAEPAPKKAAPKPEPAGPKLKAAPEGAPMLLTEPVGAPDDLKLLKGVGPKLEAVLNDMGFFHFDQIAQWTPAQVAWVDENMEGVNRGRASRDGWVDQAKILATGALTEFAKRVEAGEVPTSQ
jgi:NADH-quinone oxidoreductase subunit E